MKTFVIPVLLAFLGTAVPFAQVQGPNKESTETVGKPRRKEGQPPSAAEEEQPKIPSKYNRKEKETLPEGPSFRSDANTVDVEVAVMDNKGNFIPNIPRGNFRVLEDGVPQTITSFGL